MSAARGIHLLAVWALAGAAACGGTVRRSSDGGVATGGGAGGSSGFAGTTGNGGTAVTPGGSGGNGPLGDGGYWSGTGGSYPPTYDAGASECFGIVERGEIVAPDLLFLIDRSESMSCTAPNGGTRWTRLKSALAAFVGDGSTRNVGIQYFGGEVEADAGDAGASCDPNDYRSPDVEIGPLNGAAIIDSLERHEPGGRTPTAAALAGAIDHVIDWSHDSGGHPAIALVTDGEPDVCGSSADVVSVATAGANKGITTFVIGLSDSGKACLEDPAPARQNDLDAIAKAGNSRNAFMVDVTGGVEMEFINALSNLVLSSSLACRYKLPVPQQGLPLDLTKVNVGYSAAGSERQIVPLVSKGACDPTGGGWYFDDASNPTEIELCPESCDAIGAMRGNVDITIGCPSRYLGK